MSNSDENLPTLKSLSDRIKAFTVARKQLLVGIGISLIVSAVVAVICEIATYSYCIFWEGVRPPLEGVPFIRLGVFVVAFVIWSGVNLITTGIWLLVKYFNCQAVKEEIFLLSLMNGLIAVAIAKQFFGDQHGLQFLVLMLLFPVIVGVFSAIVTVARKTGIIPKSFSDRAALITRIVATTAFLLVVFYPPTAEKFLKYIKFGGGISVVVEFEESGGAEKTSTISGRLIIRSSKSLILKLFDSDESQEINFEYVRRIKYLTEQPVKATEEPKKQDSTDEPPA